MNTFELLINPLYLSSLTLYPLHRQGIPCAQRPALKEDLKVQLLTEQQKSRDKHHISKLVSFKLKLLFRFQN